MPEDSALLDTLKKALESLLDSRDFLGYQLSAANGMMSEEDLEEVASKYLHPLRSWEQEELLAETRRLARVIPERLDCELLSLLLRITPDRAAQALSVIAKGSEQP